MNLAESGVVVLFGVIVCLAVGSFVLRGQRKLRDPYSAPDTWGVDPDDLKWEAEADEIRHTALSEVRETAKSWAASITALLGVGATVGFVKGEGTFAKLNSGEGNFAFWLIVAAVVFAAVSILTASLAAQGTPQRVKGLDGWTLSKMTRQRARTATTLLLWSRMTAVIAAVAVFVGFGISWHAGIASNDSGGGVSAIAVTKDGAVRCGQLSSSPDGALSLAADDRVLAIQNDGDVDIVDSCPKPE